MPQRFTPEFRDRAVRMVCDRQAAQGGPEDLRLVVVESADGTTWSVIPPAQRGDDKDAEGRPQR